MGVDCEVSLPPDVRMHDVETVLGILLGLPKHRQTLTISTDRGEVWCTRIDGSTVRQTDGLAEMVVLSFARPDGTPLVDGEHAHSVFYHFEGEHGARLVVARSYPVWLAAFRRLAAFFGGVGYDSDDDRVATSFCYDRLRYDNGPDDGVPWQQFQQELFDVPPLTRAEIDAVRRYAAYGA